MPSAQPCDILIDTKPLFGHCGLVTGNFSGNVSATGMPLGQEVVHATNKGIVWESWGNGRALCFRHPALTRREAASIQNVAREIRDAAEYGASRAVFKSWSGTSSFGTGAQERLNKYRTRMQNHQGVLKNVYCSELVVVAYQLGLGINQNHAAWIALDGKHTLPRTLRLWLQNQIANWTCMGVVTDSTLELTAP
ncbi:hypothetical protein [Roseomonas sp. WA12]